MRKTSQVGLNLIIKCEGISSKVKGKNVVCSQVDITHDIIIYPYLCQAGVKTIGVGCVITGETKYDNGVKISETIPIFRERLQEFESMLNIWLKVDIKQNQFDALACFCFNIPKGAKAICKMINENPLISDLENKWLSFCNANGVKNDGILRRRKEEWSVFYGS